ncbi:isoleucine--tRNA ligase [Peptoanaerobacter stomatis]|uniref:Isoleucine--tRNA ligase n=1 Tax=Peptoanaerobacter stomatis TaxID=796937 RepID=J4W876_9FIRM|nr:isoleucine--tRNA ligase [Peptoanaerobacter stomatis]EJU22011.1 isoleucine--tRNA ligase [Peptoanaerobacter stomatis]NWO24851.1 isoleucine--tRNA ligase [Peptostreptococcaceae bacterium oral taxon 081]
MKFESLYDKSVSNNEDKIIQKWEEIDLLDLSIKDREGKEKFIFYEGPPTANGKPGIHHVIARTLKDSVCRYKTMKGYQVKRKAGWDTHGLPVEIEVEKKLNLSSKQDIEKYGIQKFNESCKESVFEYESLWRKMTTRMGYLIDLDNPYITLNNDYIESEWWILDKMFKDGLIYEGHKILPYCPRCGTGLASHEVAQGYKMVKTNTLIAKFKKKGTDNEYFLAWTTTPWTLAANVGLTVSPTETYIKAKQDDEIYYLSKTLAPKVLKENYEVLEEITGKDLEYQEYEQLMPFVQTKDKAFFVMLGDFVTTEDGTGIVHTAPAFGEDDYKVSKQYNMPVLNPVGDDGKYTDTIWKGRHVTDDELQVDIIKYLAKENKIYAKEKMEHNYPHCWRCQTPLIYYAKPSYYIEVTKFKEKLIENNNSVNWFPQFVGEKRFGNWLENLNDWAISRSRYWGTPLNIWVCDECGHKESIGSRAELAQKAIEDIDDNIELHRPYVDDVTIECHHCKKPMKRVKDVIDCWFDSGSMPYAQLHYPFENKETFKENFPADFICEGIDQTRGWFYSLIAISTYVEGVSPYKNVLVNDLILDKDGKKMSKSRGNTVDPFELFEQYGADALRWYLLYVSPAWSPTRFDIDGLKEVQSKFFSTIKNIYNFFILYANTDDIDIKSFDVPYEQRSELDRWLLSKYNNLVDYVTKQFDVYDMTKVAREIQDFVNDVFSNWYIRRSRRRFWGSEMTVDKKSVYLTTYEVLKGISQLIAPLAPFISDEIYTKLTGEKSVHISYYPVFDQSKVDLALENKMDMVKNLVKLGRASREEAKIKVRQPISKVVIDKNIKEVIGELTELIKEELNVKDVEFAQDITSFMNYDIKPNFATLGKKLGAKLKPLGQVLQTADHKNIVDTVEKEGQITFNLNGEDTVLTKEDLLINVKAKEGYDVGAEGDLFIVLDTNLTKDLVQEGFAREFISKIQQMRKNNGYEMMDKILISYTSDEEVKDAITAYTEFIKDETLANIVEFKENADAKEEVLNGHNAKIFIEKA